MANKLIVEFGADTSALRAEIGAMGGTVKQSMESTGGAIGNLFGHIGEKMTSMRHISTAVATAIGLNFHSMGENLARIITGVTKDWEKANEKIQEFSKQTADTYEKIFEKRRTDEQRLAIAQEKQAESLREIDKIYAGIAAREKAAAELAASNISKQVYGYLAVTAAKEAAKKTTEEELRLAELHKNIAEQTAVIEDAQLKVKEQRVQKAKEETKQTEERAKVEEKNRQEELRFAKENFEQLLLEAKGVDNLTEEEAKRLKQLKLITTEKGIQASLEVLLAKPAAERTEDEKRIVAELIKQKELIDAQIAGKTDLVAKTGQQVTAEKEVNTQLRKHLDNILDLRRLGNGDQQTNRSLTDDQLNEKIANLQRTMLAQSSNLTGLNYYDQNLAISKTKGLLNQALEERTARTQFRLSAESLGEGAALKMQSAFEQDRFRGYLTEPDTNTKIAASLSSIDSRLATAGFNRGPGN